MDKSYHYYLGGKQQRIRFVPLSRLEGAEAVAAASAGPMGGKPKSRSSSKTVGSLRAHEDRLEGRFWDLGCELEVASYDDVTLVATESLVLEEAKLADARAVRREFGFELVQEGRDGKVLLKAPGDIADRVTATFEVARKLTERGDFSAHPNFLRVIRPISDRPGRMASARQAPWNLENDGSVGVFGADCHARAAWTITEGERNIRVAVLDEGVDTTHPWLKETIADQADFVDDNPHAKPDGDDAHGTACAGIIASQRSTTPGLAQGCSLVAVRIAKDDGAGNWVYDDFDTADAIDWAWNEAKSAVLSNSWGGGPPVDVVTNAFERARTRGRGGKGAVVVVAAGNSGGPISFPGTLPGIFTVGASNEWDQRKTKRSKDGEDWWGSCHGKSLDLLAPGVHIHTTDIRGRRGYSKDLLTQDFNGTSSAAPLVAAVAALILSIRPDLSEATVREILNKSADPLKPKWSRTHGHGRLNAYRALRAARRA